MSRSLTLVVTLLSGLFAGAGTRGAGQEIVETVRVHEVLWPVRVLPRSRTQQEVCSDPDPSQVIVEENGVRVPVVAVQPRSRETLPAVLIDVSFSMRERFPAACTAAADYLRALPSEDEAMVLTIADTLRLVAGPTLDHAALVQSVDRLTVAGQTALWDALDSMASYLAPRPGVKVLVLITDGDDSASSRSRNAAEIVARLETVESLVVFFVGIALPPPGARETRARFQLSSLARETGGRFYDLPGPDGLRSTLRDIRELVAQRSYVVYRAPAVEARRPREVRITSSAGSPCRFVNAGPARRVASREPAAVMEWEAVSGTVLRGSVLDVVMDQGLLFANPSEPAPSRLGTRLERHARKVRREILLVRPALATLETLRTPADAMIQLLETRPPGMQGSEPGRPSPYFVHGSTFLAIRPALALALLDAPAYREAAIPRLEHSIAAAFEARGLDTGAVAAEELVRSVADAAGDPDAELVAGVLAEWLGDVETKDVALDVERRLAQRLLDGDEQVAAHMISWWSDLVAWFAPATDVRTVVPLVPVHDRERDRYGFFRIHLPAPDGFEPGKRDEWISPVPLALSTLARLQSEDGPATSMDGLRLAQLEYDAPARHSRDRRVTLRFEDTDAGGALEVEAEFRDASRLAPSWDPPVPRCMSARRTADSDSFEVREAELVRWIGEHGLDCARTR